MLYEADQPDALKGDHLSTDQSHPTHRKGEILVFGHDSPMSERVANFLRKNNLRAQPAYSVAELTRGVRSFEPSLVVLQFSMGGHGSKLIGDLRALLPVPIVTITAQSNGEIDRVVALELGADDSLSEPFSLRELLARIRAVLRRREVGRIERRRISNQGGYTFEGWRLSRRNRSLANPIGIEVKLSRGEYALLLAFLESPRRLLSREHLLRTLRVYEDVFDRSIDVQVLRLRRKLELNPSEPVFIKTQRGFGYIFDAVVEPY